LVALNRDSKGDWIARKVIPEDVREDYKKLRGVSREALFKEPGSTTPARAKAKMASWLSQVETEISTLRAKAKGEGQSLTPLEAQGLAERWYS
jgi:hypothetical protein